MFRPVLTVANRPRDISRRCQSMTVHADNARPSMTAATSQKLVRQLEPVSAYLKPYHAVNACSTVSFSAAKLYFTTGNHCPPYAALSSPPSP